MSESDRGSDESFEARAENELDDQDKRAFGFVVGQLGPVLLGGLDALEQVFRRLHPPDLPHLRARLIPARDALDAALSKFDEVETPPSLEEFRTRLRKAAQLTMEALAGIVDVGAPDEGTMPGTRRRDLSFDRRDTEARRRRLRGRRGRRRDRQCVRSLPRR